MTGWVFLLTKSLLGLTISRVVAEYAYPGNHIVGGWRNKFVRGVMGRTAAGEKNNPTGRIRLVIAAAVVLGAFLLVAIASYLFSPGVSVVTGTVNYDRQFILPDKAELVISIREITDNRAPGPVIAEQILTSFKEPPVEFAIEYKESDIDDSKIYGLAASIRDGNGQLLLAPSTNHKVITFNNLNSLEIDLAAVQRGRPLSGKGAAGLVNKDAIGSEANQVAGMVDYGRQTDLPLGAELIIQLREVGEHNNSQGVIIAEKTIVNPNQSPIGYKLNYNENDLAGGKVYTLTGQIYDADGELLMTNKRPQITVGLGYLNEISDLTLLDAATHHHSEPDTGLSAVVEGLIAYSSPAALPANARLIIQIREMPSQDSSGELIAEEIIDNPGSSPVNFRISYSTADIAAERLYGISAAIYNPAGQLLLINDMTYVISVDSNPQRIDLRLAEVE